MGQFSFCELTFGMSLDTFYLHLISKKVGLKNPKEMRKI